MNKKTMMEFIVLFMLLIYNLIKHLVDCVCRYYDIILNYDNVFYGAVILK